MLKEVNEARKLMGSLNIECRDSDQLVGNETIYMLDLYEIFKDKDKLKELIFKLNKLLEGN